MTTIATSAWTIALDGISHDFDVLEVELTLDELNTVYCQGTVTVAPFPSSVDEDVRAAILAGGQRVTLSAARDVTAPTPDSQARDFDLVLHDRTINPDGTVSLGLASDEALLEVRGLVDDDVRDYLPLPVTSPAAMTVRNVVDAVLDDYLSGAALEAGAVDASVVRTKPRRNLIANPSFEVDVSLWSAHNNASSLTRATSRSSVGAASLRWTATAAGGSTIKAPEVPAKQQRWYRARLDISSQVSRTCLLFVQQLDAAGAIIQNDSGVGVASPTSGFSELLCLTYVDDPRVASVRLVVQANANALGNQHYVDAVVLEEVDPATGLTAPRYPPHHPAPAVNVGRPYADSGPFDGSYADTAYSAYDWEGTAHASYSTQTPLAARDFDLLLQEPGQSARDFLEPVIGLTGGRLFCDEARDWRLVDDTYTVAGTIVLEEATNVTSSRDVVSLSESFDGVPTSFTGVVIVYETVDVNTGVVSRSYDIAGDASGRVYRKVVRGGYPGPGEAAALWLRAYGRQRTIPVSALTDLDTTPGMGVEFTLNGIDYEAVVSRVTWTWSSTADGMTVTPRDLVEA